MTEDLSNTLKSSTGRCLYKIFGLTEQVKEFDLQHVRYKQSGCPIAREKCGHLKSVFIKKIGPAQRRLEKSFKEWEKAFVKETRRAPAVKDLSKNAKEEFDKIALCRNLVKKWKI
ncbi:uncharacterized protein [Clytia hemisphaerica]|uniref:uncharacterized protein n=1 Tax=Clytia hemisphaerica TaxID=252671 RepID=UPI0034D77F2A